MLTNDDCGGLHPDQRQMNINFKDNTYPKTMGKVLSFFIFSNQLFDNVLQKYSRFIFLFLKNYFNHLNILKISRKVLWLCFQILTAFAVEKK